MWITYIKFYVKWLRNIFQSKMSHNDQKHVCASTDIFNHLFSICKFYFRRSKETEMYCESTHRKENFRMYQEKLYRISDRLMLWGDTQFQCNFALCECTYVRHLLGDIEIQSCRWCATIKICKKRIKKVRKCLYIKVIEEEAIIRKEKVDNFWCLESLFTI